MNSKLVAQGFSVLALTVTAFGFFFAVYIGSLPVAILQASLFALNVFTAVKNKTFAS
jgi:hypothetical protein